MSLPILPFAIWLAGTNQNSIPANDNSLRHEILNGLVISKSVTAQPTVGVADGDIYILAGTHTGAQWAAFNPDDLVIYKSGTWYAFAPVDGVVVNFSGVQEQYTGSSGWEELEGGGGSGMTNPMTTAADIIVGGASGTPARLAKGTGLQVVRMNAGATAIEWATPAATPPTAIPIACSDESTALTTGVGKVTFRMPFAMTGVSVRASLTVAQASGSIFTVDVNEGGSSILSTKLTIDNTEKTSTTAATPPVVSDASLADDAEITIDIDQIGDGTAKGLKVYLIGTV